MQLPCIIIICTVLNTDIPLQIATYVHNSTVNAKSVLLGGYILNGVLTHLPGLNLLRLVCKNFAGQALLEDVTIYVLLSCLTFYIRGILYHSILIVHSSLLHI